jgi:voltage-gated potassium channel Kch
MASDESLQSRSVIEHGTTRTGRWLKARRIRIALWVAVVEGIIVALAHDFSRWTVIAVAIPVLALYVFWGRHAKSDTARQATWIAGASQALAVVVVILAFILNWLALLLAAIFAAIALLFLFSDRG